VRPGSPRLPWLRSPIRLRYKKLSDHQFLLGNATKPVRLVAGAVAQYVERCAQDEASSSNHRNLSPHACSVHTLSEMAKGLRVVGSAAEEKILPAPFASGVPTLEAVRCLQCSVCRLHARGPLTLELVGGATASALTTPAVEPTTSPAPARRFVRRHASAGAELEQPPALPVATQGQHGIYSLDLLLPDRVDVEPAHVELGARAAGHERRAVDRPPTLAFDEGELGRDDGLAGKSLLERRDDRLGVRAPPVG